MDNSEDDHDHLHYRGVDSVEKHIGVDEALSMLLERIKPLGAEVVTLRQSYDRILYDDLRSPLNVPSRDRSTRDGYAIRILANGAKKYNVVADVRIGTKPNSALKIGDAARVATGSYLPSGANSVAMIEYVDRSRATIALKREPKLGENILRTGEDIAKGSTVLKGGTRLQAQHVALLAQINTERVKVFRRPTVSFFSTGDELYDSLGHKFQNKEIKVPDINRPFIESMITTLGAIPLDLGIARDSLDAIKERILQGLRTSDALILSAGSSVGERDYAGKAAESITGVKILVHGIAMRPSSPTGLGVFKGKPLILLPGFPTSAFMSFFVFARAAILKLAGEKTSGELAPVIEARLVNSYDGKSGIKHYIRVKVERDKDELVASIVTPTEAYYTSWLGKANGIVVLNENKTKVSEGDKVRAFMIGSID
jgi:molybdopterin molybdotransferase